MRKLLLFYFTAFFLFSCLTTQSQTRKEKKLVIGGVGSLDTATQKKIALKLKTLLGL